jgi:hypothetical protein
MTVYGAHKSVDGRVERRNYGKGHGYKIDGEKCQGVTGVMDHAVPKPALVGWAAGAVAAEIYDDLRSVLDDPNGELEKAFYVRAIEKQSRDAFIASMKGVPYNERDEAARRGTEVHKLAEELALGKEVNVPEALVGHVDSYLLFEKQWNPTNVYVELVVGHFLARYMGTLDMLAHLGALRGRPLFTPDGRDLTCRCEDECLSLVDIKTNKSGPFGDTMYQLAAYQNAEFYIDSDGNIQPMPEVRHCFVLWLRADGYDLTPYDITPDDFKAFRHAQVVAHTNSVRTRNVKLPALAPPKGN